jgi:hypothetical protein
MGFMDKAKKLAEQAQQKLDEAQENFNKSGSPQAGQEAGEVRYDEHGRPIQESPPAGEAPPPSAEPAAPPPPAAEPSAPAPPGPEPTAPAPPEAAEPPPPAPEGGGQGNAAPDPFKPLQQ